jgi:hypothetical protein
MNEKQFQDLPNTDDINSNISGHSNSQHITQEVNNSRINTNTKANLSANASKHPPEPETEHNYAKSTILNS